MKALIIDGATGITEEVELTEEEIAELKIIKEETDARKAALEAEEAAKAAAKAEILNRLGITEDEAKLLLA